MDGEGPSIEVNWLTMFLTILLWVLAIPLAHPSVILLICMAWVAVDAVAPLVTTFSCLHWRPVGRCWPGSV